MEKLEKTKKNMLVLGQSMHLSRPLPRIFTNSGFNVHFIHKERMFAFDKRLSSFIKVDTEFELIKSAVKAIESNQYDLVVLGDDETINAIKNANIDIQIKTKLLPVMCENNFNHLCSKIELSKAFEINGIPTPDYREVHNKYDLETAIFEMGYPLILKGDRSGGGAQTFECLNEFDRKNLLNKFNYYPAILQRKVHGDLVGIEAFYQNTNLIHYAYSKVLESSDGNEFSPSVLRTFTQNTSVDKRVVFELEMIGKALGANGFSNISAIYSPITNSHMYFEADMRPTAWVGYTRYFGDSLEDKIMSYFFNIHKKKSDFEYQTQSKEQLTIPNYIRMSALELIFNKHGVWRYIPFEYITFRIYTRRIKHYILGLINLKFLRRRLR